MNPTKPLSELPGFIPAADPSTLTVEGIDRIFIGSQRMVFDAILSLDEAVAINRITADGDPEEMAAR